MDVASDPSTHRCVSGTGAWALTRWELDVSLDEPFAVFQRGSSPRLLSSQPFSSASREQAPPSSVTAEDCWDPGLLAASMAVELTSGPLIALPRSTIPRAASPHSTTRVC
jgi:hypothetical protein